MARLQPESTVTLSVLDRLIDTEPKTQVEGALTRSQSVRALRASVRRDLEWLLNSRRIAEEPDDKLVDLNKSVYIFGLPDFTTFSKSSTKDRARLLRILQTAVKQFEPRMANVRVVPVETDEFSVHTLRFRIEGLLLMDPAPEHISFDTVLQLTSGEYVVKGEQDA
ncbi:MAG TPA: type VI secretion system baseplate subunit TssE [Solibacterales bacterium]|nr:type VI secretion system baseplate subunit TssE [Bryobacterales bacterium]